MYPDFEMLDYTLGACDTSPIQAVIVANNTNESRATFFILDHEGVGTISFDDEKKSYYRPEDGLRLEGNTIIFSLTFETEYGTVEIHDYRLGVAKNTVYTNNETVRDTVRK